MSSDNPPGIADEWQDAAIDLTQNSDHSEARSYHDDDDVPMEESNTNVNANEDGSQASRESSGVLIDASNVVEELKMADDDQSSSTISFVHTANAEDISRGNNSESTFSSGIGSAVAAAADGESKVKGNNASDYSQSSGSSGISFVDASKEGDSNADSQISGMSFVDTKTEASKAEASKESDPNTDSQNSGMSFVDIKTEASKASDSNSSQSSMSFVDAANLSESERSVGESASIQLVINSKEKDGKTDMGDSSGIGSFIDASKELADSSDTIPVDNLGGSLGMDYSSNTVGLDNISQILADMGMTDDTQNQVTDNSTVEDEDKESVEKRIEASVESEAVATVVESPPGIEKLFSTPGMDSSTPSIGIDGIDEILAGMEDAINTQKETPSNASEKVQSKAEEPQVEEAATEPIIEDNLDDSDPDPDKALEGETKSEEDANAPQGDVEGSVDLLGQMPQGSENTDQTEENVETEIDELMSITQTQGGDDPHDAEAPNTEYGPAFDLQKDIYANVEAGSTNEEQGPTEATETNEGDPELKQHEDTPSEAVEANNLSETEECTPPETAKKEDQISDEDGKADEAVDNNVQTDSPDGMVEQEAGGTQVALEQNIQDLSTEKEEHSATPTEYDESSEKEASSERNITACRSNVSGSSGVSQYTHFTTESASTYQHKNTATVTTPFVGDDFSVISEKSLATDQSSSALSQVGMIPLMTTLETEEYRKERERLELRKVALVEMSNSFRRISEGSVEEPVTSTDTRSPTPSPTIYSPGVTTNVPPPPPPPPVRVTEPSSCGDVEMKDFNKGRKVEISKRAMGQRPHELPSYPLIVEKTVDVTQLIKIGVLLIVAGCIGSIYADRTCHFASILKYIGYYGEPFHLYAGMYEYTSLDSAFTGHAFCLPYDSYYSASEPIIPRVGGKMAIFSGLSSAFILWFYLIMLKTNHFFWNLGIFLAITACVCQASTFYFFFDEVCAEEVCRIGPGSFMSALALFTYATAAYAMHKNRPTAARGQPTNLYESEGNESSSYTAPTIPTIV